MSPKEELIQAIHQSPDEVIEQLLSILSALQQKRLSHTSELDLSKTVLERMGGEPKHMLSVGGLSDRDKRHTLISECLQQKYNRPQP